MKVIPASPQACAACPWRLSNQGSTPDPHKFYTKGNLARLWKGLRNGARMSCHPTDPRMAEFEGYEACADQSKTSECAGGLILQQREFSLFVALCKELPKGSKKGLKLYKETRPTGLTRHGLIQVMERQVFAGTGMSGNEMARPELDDSAIGFERVPWNAEIRDRAFKGDTNG
jgi:hypothetical protein